MTTEQQPTPQPQPQQPKRYHELSASERQAISPAEFDRMFMQQIKEQNAPTPTPAPAQENFVSRADFNRLKRQLDALVNSITGGTLE